MEFVAEAVQRHLKDKEEEEEENLHETAPVLYVTTIVMILSFLIATSVFFEVTKDYVEEMTSPELQPVLTSLFGELTVLGFIGIVLFFTFKIPAIQNLNTSLYDEENAINEMSETVHMALFLVMVIFLGTDLLLVRTGSIVEAHWKKLRENIFVGNTTDVSRRKLREFVYKREMITTKAMWFAGGGFGFSADQTYSSLEQATFFYLRQRLFRQKAYLGVKAETFDLASYFSAAQGRLLAELVEIPLTTFGLIEIVVIAFAIFTLFFSADVQCFVIMTVAYLCPVVLHAVDCKCRAMIIDTCMPEVESESRVIMSPRGASSEKSPLVQEEDPMVKQHENRFWLGKTYGYTFMLGLIRKSLLANSIYVTLMITSFTGVLLDDEKHSLHPHVAKAVLIAAWMPPFITFFKLFRTVKNFVIVASVESMLSNRDVLLVMRKVQTRSAFLALKLTEIMKREMMCKKAATMHSMDVPMLGVLERMAYRKIFEEFDDDKSGSVTHRELEQFLKKMNPEMQTRDIHDIVELLDNDNSGDVDFNEFLGFVSKVSYLENQEDSEHTETLLAGMFSRVDDDNSGELSVEELTEYLKQYFKEISVDDVYNLIASFQIDENGTGSLDKEEFEEFMIKLDVFKEA